MSRRIWPEFALYSGALEEVTANGRAEEVVADLLPQLLENPPQVGSFDTPVALRWTSVPLLGFPRQPFEVYRRFPHYQFDRLVDIVNVNGPTVPVEWGLVEMYAVTLNAEPTPGFSLVVEGLNRNREPIPGQRIVFSSGALGLFRCPNIAALRVRGRGRLTRIQGVDQLELVNDKSWELIQRVGLPFKSGQIDPSAYDAEPQGFLPAALPGREAAMIRLMITVALHLSMPATGVADIPTPHWPPPDPDQYLFSLSDASPSILGIIQECLENTDDSNLDKMQAAYIHQAKVDGIRQADLAGAPSGPDPTFMNLPVVGITLLSTSSDSYAAVGLGFGTIDFPPLEGGQPFEQFVTPPGAVFTSWDYMVAAKYELPIFGGIELGALACTHPPAERPAFLSPSSHQKNRAPAVDQAATESVRLQWNLSSLPQGYGIVLSEKAFSSRILNAPRTQTDGFEPFIPNRPDAVDGAMPAGVNTNFIDPVSILPLSGSNTVRYLVAGLDVFGRWSSFRLANYTAAALPVQLPGLHAATLLQDGDPAPGSRVVPTKIEIEFAWDWSDRRPHEVVFTGGFYDPTLTTVPVFASGFRMSDAPGTASDLIVRFNPTTDAPFIASAHLGDVEQLVEDPPDPDRRRYRLIVEGLSSDYTSVSEVAYAVYARAAERVRSTELSGRVGPVTSKFADPIVPPVPAIPADLQWTALPDATGRARGLLEWTPVTNAAGYIVWQATETGLRAAMEPPAPPPDPADSLEDRALELRLLLLDPAAQTRSLQTFQRLNTQLITAPRFEVEFSGAASTIYAYRISTVSRTNQESPRSNAVSLFAVPHRNIPGQPRLLLRPVRPSGGVKVTALPGIGATPAGYQVFRVRSQALLFDVGGKGPPKILPTDPGWTPETVIALDGRVENGHTIVDPVAPSWLPYYYQIVAVGHHDPDFGEFGGESEASAVQEIYYLPPAPPLLETVSSDGNTTNRVVTFRSDLPLVQSPLGDATLTVTEIVLDTATRTSSRTSLLAADTHTIAEGPPLAVLDSPTAAELAALPVINRRPPDAAGVIEYSVHLRAEVEQGVIIAQDPGGRIVELQF